MKSKKAEAKEALCNHNPEAANIISEIEGNTYAADHADLRKYLDAVLHVQDNIDKLVVLDIYMEQRRESRKRGPDEAELEATS